MLVKRLYPFILELGGQRTPMIMNAKPCADWFWRPGAISNIGLMFRGGMPSGRAPVPSESREVLASSDLDGKNLACFEIRSYWESLDEKIISAVDTSVPSW
jgi:hypothetical protein